MKNLIDNKEEAIKEKGLYEKLFKILGIKE